jgi:hypothetical protein
VIEKQILPLLLFGAALAMVLPTVQTFYKENLPPLKFTYVNLFLGVVLMFAGCMALGSLVDDSSLTTADQSESNQADVPAITIQDVRLCNALVENTCDGDYDLFGRDNTELFIVGTPDNFAAETPLTLEVKYTPQPGQTQTVKNETFPQPVQDGKIQLKYTPEELFVGSYEVILSSDVEGFNPVSKTFQVWPTNAWIDAIAQQTKPEVDTELTGLKVCEDTSGDIPGPDEQTRVGQSYRCPADQTEFPSNITLIQADADLEDAQDGVQLTFQWFYKSADGTWEELNVNTVNLERGLSGFLFTLRADFTPGQYEVLAMLEASNRPPLRHTFTVVKAE